MHGQMAAVICGHPSSRAIPHVNIYSRFFQNLHLIVIQSLKHVRVPLTRILHYVSNKFDVSTEFRFLE